MGSRNWMASPSLFVPMLAHLLPTDERDPYKALCGKRHKEWWPVTKFADPSAFERCQVCDDRFTQPPDLLAALQASIDRRTAQTPTEEDDRSG